MSTTPNDLGIAILVAQMQAIEAKRSLRRVYDIISEMQISFTSAVEMAMDARDAALAVARRAQVEGVTPEQSQAFDDLSAQFDGLTREMAALQDGLLKIPVAIDTTDPGS